VAPEPLEETQTATERILEAAQEVFAAEGLEASLSDIALHAGVGVGSIYRRFDTKNDLIQELAARRFAGLVERMSAGLEDTDPWEAFSAEFRRSVAEYAADRGFRELVLSRVTGSMGWARGSEPDRLNAAMRKWGAAMESVIGRLITRAQKSGELRSDVDGSVILQLSIALQSTAGLAGPGQHEQAISIVLDGLRNPRTGRRR